ncbi:MAG: 16S rRNA (uracil(1498)-N(3))-methyltransferase, partial [Calditrichia bacterium]|nr:16S rRNA (uracil(1498)-N(3))-methyltransferase [Calditrichia bacterium]
DEIEKAEQHQFQPLHLGPTILRTETAAIAGITFLKSRTNPANIR